MDSEYPFSSSEILAHLDEWEQVETMLEDYAGIISESHNVFREDFFYLTSEKVLNVDALEVLVENVEGECDIAAEFLWKQMEIAKVILAKLFKKKTDEFAWRERREGELKFKLHIGEDLGERLLELARKTSDPSKMRLYSLQKRWHDCVGGVISQYQGARKHAFTCVGRLSELKVDLD